MHYAYIIIKNSMWDIIAIGFDIIEQNDICDG